MQVSQKFCNILVIWGTIQQLWMLLPRLWRWWTTLECKMPNSPDTLRMLITRFASIIWSTASESSFKPTWPWRLLQPKQNFLNHMVNYVFIFCTTNIFGCFHTINFQIRLHHLFIWLVGWVLWHINLCRLFNAKSIFIQIISSILNNSV